MMCRLPSFCDKMGKLVAQRMGNFAVGDLLRVGTVAAPGCINADDFAVLRWRIIS